MPFITDDEGIEHWVFTQPDDCDRLGRLPAIGAQRACPDCGRPQHYTGTEHGWAHDAAFATLACGASPALLAELEK